MERTAVSDSEKPGNEAIPDERYELPPGWGWGRLGDHARLVGGGTPRRDRQEFYEGGTIPWATPTDIDQDRILAINQTGTRITNLGLSKSSAQLLPAGTVLFSSRASIGKIAIAALPIATNQGFANFIPSDGLDAWYLAYCLRRFTEEIRALASGTTYLEVSKAALREFAIPTAPLPEQRRIAARIDTLFEQSLTARQALDRIPPLLKKFRQSVLAAAFRGDLTRDWRENHPDIEPTSVLLDRIRAERRRKWEEDLRAKSKDPRKVKYEETMPVDTSDLPELPQGWVWVKFGNLISFVTSGSRGWAKYYSDTGPIFLRIGNLDHDSISLNLAHVARVQPPDGVEGIRTKVEPGDILISITADVGMVGIVPEDIGDTYINQHVALARPHLGPSVSYLAYYLASQEGGQKQFTEMQYGMTKSGLNLANVKDVRIPFAPLSEQLHIVTKIQEMLTHAEAIEAAVVAAQRRADKVDQSILARAFRGELVPQDPNDEPASVLLNRIRAERGGEDRQIRPF